MPFDQSVITSVVPPRVSGGQLYLAWTSSAPAGSWYQVYVGGRLTWTGQRLWTTIQAGETRVRIDIGAVSAAERFTDFSAVLDPPPDDVVRLRWTGGTFEGADLAGWKIFGETTAGGGVDYTTPLATIAAVEAGVYLDGFGLGGFGEGGFGASAGTYSWTSPAYTGGTWTFAVVPYDQAGNLGTAATVSKTLLVPPAPPARNGSGDRLTYSYNATSHVATLTWLASPG